MIGHEGHGYDGKLIETIVQGKPAAIVQAFEDYVKGAAQYDTLILLPNDIYEEAFADWITEYAVINPDLILKYTGWRQTESDADRWSRDGETVDTAELAQRLKATRHPDMIGDFAENFNDYAFGWTPDELRESGLYDSALASWLMIKAQEDPAFLQAAIEGVL